MKDGFAAAMRHATLLTRRGDVAEATRVIRTALGGGKEPLNPEAADAEDKTSPLRRHLLRLVKPGTEYPPIRKAPIYRGRMPRHLSDRPECGSRLGRCCKGCARAT